MTEEFRWIDHLVIAGPDLTELETWWRRTTGVDPVPGGAHPGMGTRNLLVGLGEQTYIELIGPDPHQEDHVGPRPFGINDLTSVSLVTLAVVPVDLDASVRELEAMGIDAGEIRAMGRRRPDGVELSWRVAFPHSPSWRGTLPFLMEWGKGTPHPAESLVQECSLVAFELTHPEPSYLEAAIYLITKQKVNVGHGDANIRAVLDTPRGKVELWARKPSG